MNSNFIVTEKTIDGIPLERVTPILNLRLILIINLIILGAMLLMEKLSLLLINTAFTFVI